METKTIFKVLKRFLTGFAILFICIPIMAACGGGDSGGGNAGLPETHNESKTELYDDFSSDQIDLDKWILPNLSDENRIREIRDDRCYLTLKNNCNNSSNNSLQFADSTDIREMKVKAILREVNTQNNGTAILRIAGAFYSDGSDTDIWAIIQIGASSSGQLVASCWVIRKYPDNSQNNIEFYTFGNVSLNEEYLLSLSYDGDKTFSFGLNEQVHTIQGSPRLGNPHNIISIYKLIGLRISNCDIPSSIAAEIDDVVIRKSDSNGQSYQNENPALSQDLSALENNNGQIIEHELLFIKSAWSEQIDCYKMKYLSDGLKVIGFIVKPKNIMSDIPVLIYNRGGYGELSKIVVPSTLVYLSYLSANNYVVIASQYRGNDGGEGKDEFGGSDINDVLNLIPLSKSLSFTNSENMVMLGYSRGGMMTYQALKEGATLKAAAVIGGVAVFDEPYTNTGWMKEVVDKIVGPDKSEWIKRSAISWIEKLNVPILILHGEKDTNVDVNQAITLSGKLDMAGIVHSLYIFPNGDHMLHSYQPARDKMILDWFDKYLSL